MSETDPTQTPPVAAGAETAPEPSAEGFTPGLTREQQLESELAEAQDRYMRNLAETENFKKRVERERVEERAYSSQKIVVSLLPLVDNLERALNAAKAQGGEAEGPLAQLEKGRSETNH
jgi:molecular chaperone GrpE (heat shock protein)